MKVHLNQIPHDGLRVEGDEDHDILEINDELVRAVSPVHYVLDIGTSEGGLFATGRLSVNLEMECVRCLKNFIRPFELNDFAMQMELTGPERIDLTPAMREDILLALPAHPHCDWDNVTICPGVRSALEGNHLAANQLNDETGLSEAPKAWEALDKLEIRPRS